MPYKDPQAKRANDLVYKSARRDKLAAQERERQARLRAVDPEAWRANVAERSRQFRARHREDAAFIERCRAQVRKHWEKVKDDPVIKEKNRTRAQAWYRENTARAKAATHRAHKARLANDLPYKLGVALHRRMFAALNKKGKKAPTSNAVRDLGCSLPDLAAYLEARFQSGMSWDNWGRKGWHIDHIKSLRLFDLTNPTEFAAACHYSNLQPLWHSDNLAKELARRRLESTASPD